MSPPDLDCHIRKAKGDVNHPSGVISLAWHWSKASSSSLVLSKGGSRFNVSQCVKAMKITKE